VLLANNGFINDAHSAASSKGMPGIRIIGETVPCESTVISDIEKGVAEVMKEVVDALVRPLTADEKSPNSRQAKPQGSPLREPFRR
jgi:hypothetical protein